jgi:hypothetical protein
LQASADNPLFSIYNFFGLNVNKQMSRQGRLGDRG